jgi:hypothetical protein
MRAIKSTPGSLGRTRGCTDKKENYIFLIYKEIQNGTVAKLYMTTASSYMVHY